MVNLLSNAAADSATHAALNGKAGRSLLDGAAHSTLLSDAN